MLGNDDAMLRNNDAMLRNGDTSKKAAILIVEDNEIDFAQKGSRQHNHRLVPKW